MIRFASIPKCASRSLKEAGVLGEVEGRFHRPITEYPDFIHFKWYMVTRSPESWYQAWWNECRLQLADTAEVLGRPAKLNGLEFVDFDNDIWMLNKFPSAIADLPCRLLVNAWIPADNPIQKYANALERGLDFREFCIETITAGMRCIEVPIEQLDGFLLAHGYTPQHKNMSEIAA